MASKDSEQPANSEERSQKFQEPPKTPPDQIIPEPTSPPGALQRFRRPRSNGFSEFNEKDGSYLKRPFLPDNK
jgi:hypothetical protein